MNEECIRLLIMLRTVKLLLSTNQIYRNDIVLFLQNWLLFAYSKSSNIIRRNSTRVFLMKH